MKRALILVALAAASAGCQRASASTEAPAAPQAQERTPDRFMPRRPDNRERIQRGQVSCNKPVASVPC
jgi:hypothetical protein